MVSRKINTDAIDENLLIASIGKSKIGTTTASILDGASQSQVKESGGTNFHRSALMDFMSLQPYAAL